MSSYPAPYMPAYSAPYMPLYPTPYMPPYPPSPSHHFNSDPAFFRDANTMTNMNPYSGSTGKIILKHVFF